MSRKSSFEFTAKDLFIALTMLAIASAVVVYGNQSTYVRTKAYEQTATGIRIESEDMTLTGGVTKDSTGGFIQF